MLGKTLPLGAAALALTLTAGHASAAVVGQFVDLGTATDPFNASVTYDVFGFQIASDEGPITTLDFTSATGGGFTGDLVNTNPGTFTFSDTTDFPVFGSTPLPESFFVVPTGQAPPAVTGSVVDSASTLEGFFSLQGTTPLVLDNTPTIVAVLTVTDGTTPAFVGGQAVVGGNLVDIIPEPASVALLGLGTLALVGRRRRRG